MYKCKRCEANFDCGELVNGVCIDCLEEEKQEILINTKISRIVTSPFYQMEINEFLSG